MDKTSSNKFEVEGRSYWREEGGDVDNVSLFKGLGPRVCESIRSRNSLARSDLNAVEGREEREERGEKDKK